MTGPAVPSLSQIRNWDTAHLDDAARFWQDEASHWEHSFTVLFQQMARPGGQPWDGDAADQAQLRAYLDRLRVIGIADELTGVAKAASKGANDLRAAQKNVLDVVDEATRDGFDVGEEFSVTDPRMLPAPILAQRTAQAQAYQTRIVTAAIKLAALDDEVAGKVASAMDAIENIDFGDGNAPSPALTPPPPARERDGGTTPANDSQQPRLEDLIPTEGDWILTGANAVGGTATDGVSKATVKAITDAPGPTSLRTDTGLLRWFEDPAVQGFSRVGRVAGVAMAAPGVFADIGEGDSWQKAVTRETVGTATGMWAGGVAGGWAAGALLGAEIGSVVPGAGTAIGVVVGAAVGALVSTEASKVTGEIWDAVANVFG